MEDYEVDLFRDIMFLPNKVREVLWLYRDAEFDYASCEGLVKSLNEIGYTCEYYLDAEPYNLRSLDNMENARLLWEYLGEIPFYCDRIEGDFLFFTVGTERSVIWKWFEDFFGISIAEDLMPN